MCKLHEHMALCRTGIYSPCFTEKKTEAQRGALTSARGQSWSVRARSALRASPLWDHLHVAFVGQRERELPLCILRQAPPHPPTPAPAVGPRALSEPETRGLHHELRLWWGLNKILHVGCSAWGLTSIPLATEQ